MTWRIEEGDCLERLREMPAESVQCCITSPPYFGLRDYGTGEWEGGEDGCDHLAPAPGGHVASGLGNYDNGLSAQTIADKITQRQQQYRDVCGKCGARRTDRQLGLEATSDEYVARLVEVFREVRRVLRADGTLWLNIGDSYASNQGQQVPDTKNPNAMAHRTATRGNGVKGKDLLMIPAQLALALRADGWYLRSEIVWSKLNPMPESVTDRPTSAHEKLFLLSKRPRYYFDADAIREPNSEATTPPPRRCEASAVDAGVYPDTGKSSIRYNGYAELSGRNKRNVWEIATQPYAEAHFATFPPKLVEPCVLAGTSPKACGECGAPWARVVERGASSWEARKANGATRGNVAFGENVGAGTQRGVHGPGVSHDLTPGPNVTTGWESSCAHDDDTGRSVILDPFAGSGTVGVVCEWYGRDFIGIELSAEYAEMARRRIVADGRLGRRASGPKVVATGQGSLLD